MKEEKTLQKLKCILLSERSYSKKAIYDSNYMTVYNCRNSKKTSNYQESMGEKGEKKRESTENF